MGRIRHTLLPKFGNPSEDSGSEARYRVREQLAGLDFPYDWDSTCEFGPDEITGLATTAFPFDTFGIPVPQVARVLSVDDHIRLELEVRVIPEGR